TCPDGPDHDITAATSSRSPRGLAEASALHTLHDELAHAPGVRLAARRLHDRTDDDAHRAQVAAADLLRDVGLRGERGVYDLQQRAVVGDDLQPAGGDDLLRAALAGQHALEHLPGQLVVDATGVDQRLQLTDLRRRHRQLLERDLLGLRCAGQLTPPPRARRRRARARGDRGLDEAERARVDDVAHLGVGVAPLGLQPAPAGRRQLGQARADLLDPLARGRDRHEVRLREVPVVLGVGLHPTGRRRAGVLVEVARLLHDRATAVEHLGLPGDLDTDGTLDRAERVDVLRLGTRA